MIIEWDLKQGSDEWLDARCGVISASCFGEIFTPTGKPATGVKVENYANKLIAETLTGKPSDTFKSDAMERGIEMESEARNWYEMATGEDVSECGLVYLNDLRRVSCSPDGLLVASDGVIRQGLEIKCPLAHTQVKYLLSGKVPTQYMPQLQGSMMVTGATSWDFLSYHPDLEPLLITVQRDDKWIDEFIKTLTPFVDRIQSGVNQLSAEKPAEQSEAVG